MNFLRDVLGLRSSEVFGQPSDLPAPEPIRRRVLAVIHNPVFRSRGGQKASRVFNWNDPDRLAQEYIEDIRWCSDGYANYEIAERIEVDGFPIKRDGFVYNAASFMDSWQTRLFHEPDAVDYLRLVRQLFMIPKVDNGAIVEVWLASVPCRRVSAATMARPGAS